MAKRNTYLEVKPRGNKFNEVILRVDMTASSPTERERVWQRIERKYPSKEYHHTTIGTNEQLEPRGTI